MCIDVVVVLSVTRSDVVVVFSVMARVKDSRGVYESTQGPKNPDSKNPKEVGEEGAVNEEEEEGTLPNVNPPAHAHVKTVMEWFWELKE